MGLGVMCMGRVCMWGGGGEMEGGRIGGRERKVSGEIEGGMIGKESI